MRTALITGANRGLGLALTKWAADQGYRVFASSRHAMPLLSDERSSKITHISADLLKAEMAIDAFASVIGDVPLDFIIHNAGLVEPVFEDLCVQDAQDALSINLLSPLLLTRAFLPNLRAGQDKKIIFIGSVSGQNNSHCPEIFYAASRMGLIGATQNLRQNYKADGLSFPVIEPGCMATDVDYDDGADAALDQHNGDRMPVQDLIRTVAYILSLSSAACPRQITVSNMTFGPV